MSKRPLRVGKLIQQEIADILQTEFAEYFPMLVTVTGVEMSRDLSVARVYVSVYASSAEERRRVLQKLQELTPRLRGALASRIRHHLRFMPELRFELDETLEQASRLEALFQKIHEEQGRSASEASERDDTP